MNSGRPYSARAVALTHDPHDANAARLAAFSPGAFHMAAGYDFTSVKRGSLKISAPRPPRLKPGRLVRDEARDLDQPVADGVHDLGVRRAAR